MILSNEKRTVIKGKRIAIINEFGDIIEGLLSNEVLDKDDIIKLVEKVAEKVKADKVIKKALEDGKNG